jgi:hypothetical protein
MYLIGFNLIFEIFGVSNFSGEMLPMLKDFFADLKMKNLSLMPMISCYDIGLSLCDSQMVNDLMSSHYSVAIKDHFQHSIYLYKAKVKAH